MKTGDVVLIQDSNLLRGLAGPFTVRAKILMRHLWGSDQKLDWDDPIPEENRENWILNVLLVEDKSTVLNDSFYLSIIAWSVDVQNLHPLTCGQESCHVG